MFSTSRRWKMLWVLSEFLAIKFFYNMDPTHPPEFIWVGGAGLAGSHARSDLRIISVLISNVSYARPTYRMNVPRRPAPRGT